jgi:hypothetical protein
MKMFHSKITMMLAILALTILSGCKTESSQVKSAMERFSNNWPTPRTRSACNLGAGLITTALLGGRDNGLSVDDYIVLLKLSNRELSNDFLTKLSLLYIPLWDSKESAANLSAMYMDVCIKS